MRLFTEHETRKVIPLNGAWRFLLDENDEGEKNGWQNGLPDGKTVIVPSSWNNEIGLLNYMARAWYERKFTFDGGTLRIVFEAVANEATIWLDGKKIGYHYGGFTMFDIIASGIECGEHTLVVLVNSELDKKSLPQHKVDWFNYGGIVRDVYAEVLEGVCVLSNNLKYELSDDFSSVSTHSSLVLYNASDKATSSPICVCVGDTQIFNSTITLGPRETLELDTPERKIDGVKLWSDKNPHLYYINAKTDSDDLIDRVGFRKIEARDNKILLNGEQIELRGVNRHEEHPDWGFAFPAKLMTRDLDIVKDLGCNTIRGAHYPQSFALLDMLDERGLLFWSEIPIWGGGFDDKVLGDPVVVERGLNMHREMTSQYYNHPSIIIWGMHNEIYTLYPCTYGISKQYSELLRAKGGNRLITHAAAFPFDDDSLEFDDIICINMYHGWYGGNFGEWDKVLERFKELREKLGMSHKPVIFSEFGAGALAGFHSAFDTMRWSEEYQADLLEYCLELFHKDEMVSGFYIWQFCNIRTMPDLELNRVRCFNNKGILDEYRNPKNAYFKVKKLYHKYASEK